jgi:uncharacterized protein YcbK (DUF882 family)
MSTTRAVCVRISLIGLGVGLFLTLSSTVADRAQAAPAPAKRARDVASIGEVGTSHRPGSALETVLERMETLARGTGLRLLPPGRPLATTSLELAPRPPRLFLALDALLGAFGVELRRPDAAGATVLVQLYNVNTRETAALHLPRDGQVAGELGRQLSQFLRCRRTGQQRPIDPAIVAVLADLSAQFPGHHIEIISGFRAPPFGAPHSKHFHGRALDLRVRGVAVASVRDYLWARYSGIGVGYYAAQNFVHVDYRPDDGGIAWTARHEGAPYQYNPSWARRARQGLRSAPVPLLAGTEPAPLWATIARSATEHLR